MTAPLSPQFEPKGKLATGMFGGQKQVIAPRGSYVVNGVGDPAMGFNGDGYYWNLYANLMSGTSDVGPISTSTGSPLGTPEPEDGTGKVGGGAAQAQIPDYGGTAAY